MWIIVLFTVGMLTIIRYFVTDRLLCCSRSAHIASQWGGPASSLSHFSQWNGPVSQWYWSPAIFYACIIIIVHLTRTCAHLSEAASLMMKHSSRPYNCHTQSSWFADWLIWGLQGVWNHRTLPSMEMFVGGKETMSRRKRKSITSHDQTTDAGKKLRYFDSETSMQVVSTKCCVHRLNDYGLEKVTVGT